ncbi:MAG: DUF1579 domain-containing protein [Steroidobacter sp.]
MSAKEFEASKQSGLHRELAKLVGEWEGIGRVWFEPGKLAEEAPIRGAIRSVLDGRFVVHEYESTFMGAPQQGLAIFGYHLDRERYEVAWIDSGHNGTAIMYSTSERTRGPLNVLGHYGGDGDDAPWGWRTTIELPDANRLVITSYNITPQGEEAKAVEVVYQRVR